MEEPTTYCGASARHVFCENYKFQPNVTLRMFKRDEIYTDLTWLDIQNCSGTLDEHTFKNLPNLEIINISNSNLEKIENNTFSALKKLTSIDIRTSTFPLNQSTFEKCENLTNLRFIKLKNGIKEALLFKDLQKLEYLMFQNISGLELSSEDMFDGLNNLKYLFISRCSIENFSNNVFDHLTNLEMLYFTGNSLKTFNPKAFLKLKTLKIFGLHSNVTNSSENMEINYQTFQNLPLLETICFPEEHLKKLDFDGFKSLKTVQQVIGKSSGDLAEVLQKKNINVEWTSDMDLSEEPDLSDPNIQICA